jgi:DNA-damage-inducible protein J
MTKSAILRIRIDPRQKTAAEIILRKLGVTPSQAISMFYAQIVLQKAVPFSIALGKSHDATFPSNLAAETWSRLDENDYGHLAKR